MAMGSNLSIITLNVNGLNAPTKRQRLAEWIQKQDPICCLYGEGNGTPLQYTCLENLMDGGAGGLQSMGSLGVGHD